MDYSDVDCPYCGKGQDIFHDEGQGYEEDIRHEQGCRNCEKTFVFTTYTSHSYEVYKADCLNGASHNIKVKIYPWIDGLEMVRSSCADCEYVTGKTRPTQ